MGRTGPRGLKFVIGIPKLRGRPCHRQIERAPFVWLRIQICVHTVQDTFTVSYMLIFSHNTCLALEMC